jgi:hypothetical protein
MRTIQVELEHYMAHYMIKSSWVLCSEFVFKHLAFTPARIRLTVSRDAIVCTDQREVFVEELFLRENYVYRIVRSGGDRLNENIYYSLEKLLLSLFTEEERKDGDYQVNVRLEAI